MQREMDLIRDLLLRIDGDQSLNGLNWVHFTPTELGFPDRSPEEIGYHMNLLIEAGLIEGEGMLEVIPTIRKLTWKGHDFLDDIRDPGIWDKTKQRAKGLTSVGISFIWEIAKAEIKTKLNLP